MVIKKGKNVSFDFMVKFFLKQFNIPTRKDIDRLHKRLEQMEILIRTALESRPEKTELSKNPSSTRRNGHTSETAANSVLNILNNSEQGMDLSAIQKITGFGEKKIRNIIHRLFTSGKIIRIKRGFYGPIVKNGTDE